MLDAFRKALPACHCSGADCPFPQEPSLRPGLRLQQQPQPSNFRTWLLTVQEMPSAVCPYFLALVFSTSMYRRLSNFPLDLGFGNVESEARGILEESCRNHHQALVTVVPSFCKLSSRDTANLTLPEREGWKYFVQYEYCTARTSRVIANTPPSCSKGTRRYCVISPDLRTSALRTGALYEYCTVLYEVLYCTGALYCTRIHV